MRLRKTFEACGLAVGLIAALVRCGDSERSQRFQPNDPGTTAATGGADGTAGAHGFGGAVAAVDAGHEADAAPVPDPVREPFVDPYPRIPADPALTQRVVEGELLLAGNGISTCTNELPASGDRWCTFSRTLEEGAS